MHARSKAQCCCRTSFIYSCIFTHLYDLCPRIRDLQSNTYELRPYLCDEKPRRKTTAEFWTLLLSRAIVGQSASESWCIKFWASYDTTFRKCLLLFRCHHVYFTTVCRPLPLSSILLRHSRLYSHLILSYMVSVGVRPTADRYCRDANGL